MECAGLVRNYFNLGYNYNEIIASLLFNHNVAISKRTLNRKLRDLGLYRRKNHTDELDVAYFILQELQSSGCLHGYRWMHLKCIQNGINIDKETVRHLLGVLDPIQVLNTDHVEGYEGVYIEDGDQTLYGIQTPMTN